MVKLIFCLRRAAHLSREEFQHYWRSHHAPLVASHADTLGLQRYVQCHSLPDDKASALAVPRGSPPAFDGVAELWWDFSVKRSPAQKEAARRASAELLEDERRFIDLAASPIFYTEEHEVVAQFVRDRQGGRDGEPRA